MFICYYVSKAYVLPFDNKGNESTLLPKGDYTLFKFLAANLEFLCLNNMSLNQYVFMSFCLKNYVPLSEKPVLLSHLVYIYPPTQHRFC